MRIAILDASALLKIVLAEDGASQVQHLLSDVGFVLRTTSLCLAEALGVLKTKWLKKELTQAQYLKAAYLLFAYVGSGGGKRIGIREVSLEERAVFRRTEALAKRYDLDLSDALQLFVMQDGIFRILAPESQALLVTADEALAKAARAEGLLAWDCIHEPLSAGIETHDHGPKERE